MNHLNEFQLNEYLDDRLDTAEQAMVEAHLAECAACQEALAELQAVFLALDEVDEIALPIDLSTQVLAEWRQQTAAEPSAWLRPLLVLQFVGAIGMAIWLWPVIGEWLMRLETAVTDTLSTLQPIQINIWQQVVAWGTAVTQQLQIAQPTIDLATSQWALLIGLALIAWLAGNKLILNNESGMMNDERRIS
jgi:anti-sigma factor RsiW